MFFFFLFSICNKINKNCNNSYVINSVQVLLTLTCENKKKVIKSIS